MSRRQLKKKDNISLGDESSPTSGNESLQEDGMNKCLVLKWKDNKASKEEKYIIEAHCYEGKTFQKIAEELDGNVNTVKSIFTRAIAKIRRYVEQNRKGE
jgi:DNA-directed RNA polymerase specialized sigma24 family protein